MNGRELLNKLEDILEETRGAVFVTLDSNGCQHTRWMTPIVLKSRPQMIYTVSAADAEKISHIESNGRVEWMMQSKSLSEIVNVTGLARIVDNPALKNEIMEILAPRLKVFWTVNIEKTEFVVLETMMQEAEYFEPMKGKKETIRFTV